MTKQQLEKQVKDLRARLYNASVKKEIMEESFKEKIHTLEQELARQAPTIEMLQKHIADCERKIDGLQAENAALKKEGAVLAATVEKLGMRIKKLPGRLKKDSSSSSKPSSTDVFRKPRPQNLREKSGKKPGGQFGHAGHGLALCADETGCRVNGGLGWIQVFCNDRFALFGLNSKRGDVDEQFGILTFFLGILVHDHFMSYYQFENVSHAECNGHILRYLKGLIEIFKHDWLKAMSELMKSACHRKNQLVAAGAAQMPAEDIEWFAAEYDRMSYYVNERRLLDRLSEYKEEHLRFLMDFKTPFTNNMAERDMRKFKNKAKVSGCFRSAEGAQIYARIASVITTLKKQSINVFDGLRAVYSGQVPISTA